MTLTTLYDPTPLEGMGRTFHIVGAGNKWTYLRVYNGKVIYGAKEA